MLVRGIVMVAVMEVLIFGVAYAEAPANPTPNAQTQAVSWEAVRTLGNGTIDHFIFHADAPGVIQGSIESDQGTVASFAWVLYTDEDLLPSVPNTCKTMTQATLVKGRTYFVARKLEVGALYIEQIEEGETWVFHLDDMAMIKRTPYVYGKVQSNVKVELFDGKGRLVSSSETLMDKSSLSRFSSSSGKGELLQQLLFIGAASSEEEFGLIEHSGGEWLEVPLGSLGTIKAWSLTPGVSCKVYVEGVEV